MGVLINQSSPCFPGHWYSSWDMTAPGDLQGGPWYGQNKEFIFRSSVPQALFARMACSKRSSPQHDLSTHPYAMYTSISASLNLTLLHKTSGSQAPGIVWKYIVPKRMVWSRKAIQLSFQNTEDSNDLFYAEQIKDLYLLPIFTSVNSFLN